MVLFNGSVIPVTHGSLKPLETKLDSLLWDLTYKRKFM